MITEHFINGKYGRIYLRVDHRDNPANKLLILCHGVTYSSEAVFRYPIDGKTFVEHLTEAGMIVFTFDIVGFGQSQPSNIEGAAVTSDIALSNLHDVLKFAVMHFPKAIISLMGWSWGAQIVGKMAMDENVLIDKIILYGLPWHINQKNIMEVQGNRRVNTKEHALSDFSCIETALESVQKSFAQHALKIDGDSPNGPLLELKKTYYFVEPTKIKHTILVIHGYEDIRLERADAKHFYESIASKQKHYIVLPGSHALHMEKNYKYFINLLLNFIDN
jgi:alpha-beta hydrolase superfamily lysophospholipase